MERASLGAGADRTAAQGVWPRRVVALPVLAVQAGLPGDVGRTQAARSSVGPGDPDGQARAVVAS